MERESWKECSVFFLICGGRETFHQEIVLGGIQPCFLHGGAHGLFWNATKAAKFLLVHFALYGQENYVLKRNLCIYKCFIDVLYIFFFAAKEKLQNAPRFKMDFVLNFAMCLTPFYLRERIQDPDRSKYGTFENE